MGKKPIRKDYLEGSTLEQLLLALGMDLRTESGRTKRHFLLRLNGKEQVKFDGYNRALEQFVFDALQRLDGECLKRIGMHEDRDNIDAFVHGGQVRVTEDFYQGTYSDDFDTTQTEIPYVVAIDVLVQRIRKEAHTFLNKAVLYTAKHSADLTKKAKMYRLAAYLNPRDPLVHFNLGYVLSRLGKFDEALAEFDEALMYEPRQRLRSGIEANIRVTNERIEAAGSRNLYTKLEEMTTLSERIWVYGQMLEIDENHHLAWNNLGWNTLLLANSMLESGEAEKAEDVYLEALSALKKARSIGIWQE
jgi:tetratricopeptide (TPR) repeat protein